MNRAPRTEAQIRALNEGRRGRGWTEAEVLAILKGEIPEGRTRHAVQKKLSRLRLEKSEQGA